MICKMLIFFIFYNSDFFNFRIVIFFDFMFFP